MSQTGPMHRQQGMQPQFVPPRQTPPDGLQKRNLGWLRLTGVGIVTLVVGVAIGAADNSGSASGGAADSAGAAGVPAPTVTVTQTAEQIPGPTATKTVEKPVPAPAPTKTVTATVTAPPPEPKAAIAEDGMYLVGTDLKPGTYRSSNSGDCYWARLKNTTGDFEAIIANGNGANQIVTIRKSDGAFESSNGCAPWTRAKR